MNTSEAGVRICIYVCVLSGVVRESVRISGEGRNKYVLCVHQDFFFFFFRKDTVDIQ